MMGTTFLHSGKQRMRGADAQRIGQEDIAKAASILTAYKQGKQALESRIIEEEQWWKLRHWEYLRKNQAKKDDFNGFEPTSAWLFNSVTNKHADAMDNYPEPNVLPREQGDAQDAKTLGSIIPVVIERNNFEQTYSDNWWYKLKHGVCAYGVFWNARLENGLGDIEIQKIDLLNIFWQPGITDLQDSKNLFVVDLVDNDTLEQQYPQLAGRAQGQIITVADYLYDDTVDTSEKSVVVDWYYKVPTADGRTLLHYCKFVGATILFASENEEQYQESGWYEHGRYPIELDTLYPEEGTPVGFGVIAITKDPQMYIDKLSGAILRMAAWKSANRYWVKAESGIDKKQFLDLSEPLVEVAGSMDEEKLKPIVTGEISGNLTGILQMKIDELKETSSNRDVSQGGASAGVTAASAIAALQEAGNKGSRDTIGASYRTYVKLTNLCIELIRQFYDETREFRILGDGGLGYEFVSYSNRNLKDQQIGVSAIDRAPVFRKPVFDIVVKPQKRSTYSKIQQNELAKELFQLQVFNPELAQQTLPMVEMMEFDGKDKVLEQISQGQTYLNIMKQMQQQMDQLAGLVQQLTGTDMGVGQNPGTTPEREASRVTPAAADNTMTHYGQKLAARAVPDMNAGAGATG